MRALLPLACAAQLLAACRSLPPEQLRTEHFRIFAENAAEARALGRVAEEAWDRMPPAFVDESILGVDIIIEPIGSMRGGSGSHRPRTVASRFFWSSTPTIEIWLRESSWWEDLDHEMFHARTGVVIDDVPLFVIEGLAEHFGAPTPALARSKLCRAASLVAGGAGCEAGFELSSRSAGDTSFRRIGAPGLAAGGAPSLEELVSMTHWGLYDRDDFSLGLCYAKGQLLVAGHFLDRPEAGIDDFRREDEESPAAYLARLGFPSEPALVRRAGELSQDCDTAAPFWADMLTTMADWCRRWIREGATLGEVIELTEASLTFDDGERIELDGDPRFGELLGEIWIGIGGNP